MRKTNRKSAFTLIELLVVIGIIGVLSAMIMNLAGFASRKALRSKTIAAMGHIQNCLEEYRVKHNKYPEQTDHKKYILPVAAIKAGVPEKIWINVNGTNEWRDAWDNTFKYDRPSQFSYVLYSTGPNFIDSEVPVPGGDDIVAQGSAQ